MDSVLELSDCDNSKYPRHFEEFLNNCLNQLGNNFFANDYLFAAVYFLIVETGFTPIDLLDTIANHESHSFDVIKLKSITSYPSHQIEKMKKCSSSKPFVYKIKFCLGNSQFTSELQGVPSAETDAHLVINFLLIDHHVVKSICLDTNTYVKKTESDGLHKLRLQNLKELSLLIKNKIAVHIKDLILMDEVKGCYSNLLGLPDDIQKNIIYYLAGDAVSLSNLSATCSYFYSIISSDSVLWDMVCRSEYTAQKINDTIVKLIDEGRTSDEDNDQNLYKKAFLKLKDEEMRKHFRRKPVFY